MQCLEYEKVSLADKCLAVSFHFTTVLAFFSSSFSNIENKLTVNCGSEIVFAIHFPFSQNGLLLPVVLLMKALPFQLNLLFIGYPSI